VVSSEEFYSLFFWLLSVFFPVVLLLAFDLDVAFDLSDKKTTRKRETERDREHTTHTERERDAK
jgi:hypothetical protein